MDAQTLWTDIKNIFTKACNIFQVAAPDVEAVLDLAAAITKNPVIIAADNIVDAAAAVIADIVMSVENGTPLAIDPAKSQALYNAIKNQGSTINTTTPTSPASDVTPSNAQ
ncbi:MAG: hypothetical protein ABSG42_06865 [Nitrospirota bacterium]